MAEKEIENITTGMTPNKTDTLVRISQEYGSIEFFTLFVKLQIAVKTVLLIIGLIGNLTLIVSVLRRKEFLKSPTFILLVSLAMADVFVLLTQELGSIVPFLRQEQISLIFCKLHFYTLMSSVGISSSHLVLFSVYRFLTLVKPFFARRHITVRRTTRLCTFIWGAYLVTCSSAVRTELTRYTLVNGTINIHICNTQNDFGGKSFLMTYFIVSCALPLLLIPTFHLSKLWILRKHTLQTEHHPYRQTLSSRTVFVAVFFFLGCWSPLIVFFLLKHAFKVALSTTAWKIATFSPLLINVHSALNPFLYFFLSTALRNSACCSRPSLTLSLPIQCSDK